MRPWVDDDIDLLEVREQACIVHVADFNEVWWFFPQDGQTKNTRCIIYSYKEGWWSQGLMARTAGITSSYTAHTIMADDLVAYQHEVPNAYPANVPLPWAETYDLNLNSGSRLTTLKQLIPDVEGAVQNLLYSVFYRTSRSVALDASGNVIAAPEPQTTRSQLEAMAMSISASRRAISGCGLRLARFPVSRGLGWRMSRLGSIWLIRSLEGIADGATITADA